MDEKYSEKDSFSMCRVSPCYGTPSIFNKMFCVVCMCMLYFPQRQTPNHAKRHDATRGIANNRARRRKKESQRALADFFLREFCDNIKEVGASWLGAIQMKKKVDGEDDEGSRPLPV